MKLASNFRPKVSSKVKRKKEHLLLKPPASPELRGANDDDGGANLDHYSSKSHSENDEWPQTSSVTANKRVEHKAGQRNRRQSTENLKSRRTSPAASNSPDCAVRMGAYSFVGRESCNLAHFKATSAAKPQSQFEQAAGNRRRKFEDLRQYFDFSRLRRSQPVMWESDAGAAPGSDSLMTASGHHHHHHNHEKRSHQRPEQTSAQTSSRRKSELTSFLTILFGSMLAILLITSQNQIMCGQSGPPPIARSSIAGALNRSSSSGGRSQHGLDSRILARGTSVVANASSGSLPETTMTEPLVPTGVSLKPSAALTDDSPPMSGSASSVETEDHDDYEEPNDSSAKTKLGDLLAETARDSTDLLLNHLQPKSNDEDKAGGGGNDSADSDESEMEEENSPLNGGASGRNASLEARGIASSLKAAAQPSLHLARQDPSSRNQLDDAEQTRFALETYAKWRAAGDDLIELFSRKLMPIIIEHGYDVDAGTVGGLLQAFNGIRQLKPWALKLLDAWTKISPGVLLGTQSDFGDFDECLNIRVDDPNGLAAANSEHFPSNELDPLTGLSTTTLVGRYCLADVEFPKPPRQRATGNTSSASTSPTWPHEPIELRRPLLDFAELPAFKDTIFVETGNFFHMLYVDPIRVGICLTNKIDPQSFQQVFNKLLEEFRVTIDFRGRCVTKYDRPTWTRYQLVSAYVLVAACSLVLLSTGLDLLLMKFNKLPCPRSWTSARLRIQIAALAHRDLITSFSLVRNTKRLFKPSVDVRPAQTQSSGIHHHHHQQSIGPAATTCGAPSSCVGSLVTGSSSIADSSVESSPSIERRSSSETTTSSMKDLISVTQQGYITDQCRQQKLLASHNKGAPSCYDESTRQRVREQQATTIGGAHVSLLSLHGIRVITMIWMIINHTYMFGGFFVLWAHRRLIDISEWPKSLSFQMVLNGWLTVETYFFLSAMIIVLTVLPLMRTRKFNYFFYVLHRLLRLLPAYIGLVCLNFLWPLISSGPVWLVKGKSFVQEPCEQYLWTNFLFINNWIWPEKQCMVHTWFLSADFQLYLLAPIIVYLLYRRPALGHTLNLLVAVAAAILSGFVIYANKLLPTTLINKLEFDAIKQQLSYSYFATYQHMGPYCLGLLVGYLLYKRPHARLPKHLTWLLWLLLPPLSFTTLLLTYLWNGAYPEANLVNPSPLVSALYVAIHRTIWTALVAWLVFACATGRAKLLASFLSNAIFLPISRLSYSIYLVHLPVIMFRSLNLRHTVEWTDQNILWEACGNFVVSSLLGFFLNVAFESPIINLENVIFKRGVGATCGAISPKQPQTKVNPHSIFENATLANVLSTCHPDKQANTKPAQRPQMDRQQVASTNSSSDTCEDSMTSVGTTTQQHESPRSRDLKMNQTTRRALTTPQQRRHTGSLHRRPDQRNRAQADLLADADRPSLSKQQRGLQPQLVDDPTVHNQAYESHTNSSSACSDHSEVELEFDSQVGRQTNLGQLDSHVTGSQAAFVPEQSNELYSVAAEYQHYAPGVYQQWRRTTGRFDFNYHHPPPASSNSMRAMQYATLARANRLHQEAPTLYETSRLGRGHSTRLNRAYPQQQQMSAAIPSTDYLETDQENPTQLSYGAELSSTDPLEAGRSALIQQRQLLASRRRQGRYNTLTGTDWRNQLQARHHQVYDADLMRQRGLFPPQPAWSSVTEGVGSQGDGALFIPRIDWSSTLRRHARNNSTSLAQNAATTTATATTSASGSLLGTRQEPSEAKIEEAEETSAL